MLQMNQHYEPEFKKIVHLHLEEGRSLKGFALNVVYSKQAFLFGPNNFVKNARQTKNPKPIMIT